MQRQAEGAVKGQKKRGRKPNMVEPMPSGKAGANVTDPDSRVMKARQGYVQGYNVQAVVGEDQIIVAVGVTHEANDVRHHHRPVGKQIPIRPASSGNEEALLD